MSFIKNIERGSDFVASFWEKTFQFTGPRIQVWAIMYLGSQIPNKEMNRGELLKQPMRVQIAGHPHTVTISLSE